MKRALLSNNKYKFVNDDILEPTCDDEKYEDWERCNVMVVSWITRTLTTQIAQSTVYIDNAKELYIDNAKNDSKKVIIFAPLISYKKSILSNKEGGISQITSQTRRFCGRNWILLGLYLSALAK